MIKKFKKFVKESKKKKLIVIFSILAILEIISGGILIYFITLLSGIEDIIRYIGIIFIVLIMFVIIYKCMKVLMKPKKKIISRLIFMLATIILIFGQSIASYVIYKVYNPIDNINKSTITYTTSLITLSKNDKINDIKDVKKLKLGYISKETSNEDNKISNAIINENNLKESNELKEYDQYSDMLNDLYDDNIDALFISSNYETMFSSIDKFHNISSDTKVIVEKSMEFKKVSNKTSSYKNIVKEPFSVLLMGVDSEQDGLDKNAAFNGDSLMLITFNPNTLNATILSIPRDTYVPIACFKNQKKNKITHAAWQGVECMSNTISNFTGIDIDYYVKMNFKGVVSLVDELEGIDVNVPISFCEQDSNRMWGENEICIEEGERHLNGEEALALARHRKTLERGDIDRGLNQQLVIEGILKKLSNINNIDKVNGLLNAISKNMDTNINTNQILSFYNVGKDVLLKSTHTTTSDLISMEQLFISGYDKMIYDPDFDLTLYNYVPYSSSIKAVSNKMKENLGLKEIEMIKTFDFSINETYEKKIIGSNMSDSNSKVEDISSDTLPDLVGKTKSYAESLLKSYKFKYKFEAIEKGDPLYNDNYSNEEIISQSVKAGTNIKNISTLVLKYIIKDDENEKNEACPKNTKNSKCLLPNLVGKTKSYVDNWAKSLPVSIHIEFENLTEKDALYDKTVAGTFGKMSHEEGTNLSNITTLTLYYKNVNNDDEKEKNFKVTFIVEGNDGKKIFTETYTYKSGDALSLYIPDVTCKADETFSGWDYDGSFLVTKDMTITGKCEIKKQPTPNPPDEELDPDDSQNPIISETE